MLGQLRQIAAAGHFPPRCRRNYQMSREKEQTALQAMCSAEKIIPTFEAD
jgi:hypothetical protein